MGHRIREGLQFSVHRLQFGGALGHAPLEFNGMTLYLLE
jgi:hypothetical protein